MEVHITPSALHGSVEAVSSKSMAHRLMILASLAQQPCDVICNATSLDIEATRRCMDALRKHSREGSERHACMLDCGESGSTLRFLLPVVCAMGIPARFVRHGRLAERPLAPLDAQLQEHGAHLDEKDGTLCVRGALRPGRTTLPGDVSEQYISGLLLAAPLLNDTTEIWVRKPVQSRPYVELTIHALKQFGQTVTCSNVNGCDNDEFERLVVEPTPLRGPSVLTVEGDWSNAAFWLAAGALEPEGITVSGLDLLSPQGDRSVMAALSAFGVRIARRGNAVRATFDTPRSASLDISAIPDLAPPLSAVASVTPGTTTLRNAGRLRLKESDRLETISAAIQAMGGMAAIDGDDLVIEGVDQLKGGIVDAANDHRIAMMAAVMATHACGPTTVMGAECVQKSYPGFWDDYALLGGHVDTEEPQH